MSRWRMPLGVLVAMGLAFSAGCGGSTPTTTPSSPYGSYGSYGSSSDVIKFKDDVASNAEVGGERLKLSFTNPDKSPFDISQYQGSKNVVLVFTRGFSNSGTLCPFCQAHTARLIANYSEIAKRNAEVVVVFPGEASHFEQFASGAKKEAGKDKIPFPLVVDEELKGVEALGISGNLAKPSTFILDSAGEMRFAYIGEHLGDRPSVAAILKQLDAIESGSAAAKPAASIDSGATPSSPAAAIKDASAAAPEESTP